MVYDSSKHSRAYTISKVVKNELFHELQPLLSNKETSWGPNRTHPPRFSPVHANSCMTGCRPGEALWTLHRS